MIGGIACAQQLPASSTLTSSVNEKYLEHLIKTKIDSVRKSLNLAVLFNDSILYVASKHHSEYMKNNRKLTHNEANTRTHKTPQDRVDSYGGKNYLVGENVIYSYYNTALKNKKGKEYTNYTYEDLANDFVNGWVNSPGHYANIINPDYQITGLSISVNPERKQVYSTQKFASVNFKYQFEENQKMFEYSPLIKSSTTTKFDKSKAEYIDKKFEWNLKPVKYKDGSLCDSCNYAVENSEYKTRLEMKGRSVYLKSNDAPMISQMITKWRDGLALEFVEYTAYDCGNPEYYKEASRRNGQSIFNGKVSKPIYRRDLRKGYKKVKPKSKKRKYRWFQNMGKKGKPEYFYIKLGKIPKEMNGYFEINVVVIKDKKVCRIMHLTSWCGKNYNNSHEYQSSDTLLSEQYVCIPYQDSLEFRVDFEQGKSDYTVEDIEPIIKSVTNSKFTVLNAEIAAFSSIEGSEIINNRLQRERANSLLNSITKNQTEKFEKYISVSENWVLFDEQIDSFPDLKALQGKTKEELKTEVNGNIGKYENYLSKQRNAAIKLKVEFIIDDTLQFLLAERQIRNNSFLDYYAKTGRFNNGAYDSLVRIQHALFLQAKRGKIPLKKVTDFVAPFQYKMQYRRLLVNNFWYLVDFNEDDFWNEYGYQYLRNFYKMGIREKHLTYNLIRLEMEKYKRRKNISDNKIEDMNGKLYSFYSLTSDSFFLNRIELMKEDFLVATIKNYHFESTNFDEVKMRTNIQKLTQLLATKNYPDSILYQFSEFIVYCKQDDLAYKFLLTYLHSNPEKIHPKSLILFAKLSYTHPKEYPTYRYVDYLTDIQKHLTTAEWCSMFVGTCNISFQVLDDEDFRNNYCKTCQEHPNYAQKPEEWKEMK